jgi:Spx/MgsR family transcriptional regulator
LAARKDKSGLRAVAGAPRGPAFVDERRAKLTAAVESARPDDSSDRKRRPMAVTMYGIPNCDTIKKARTWLESHGVAYAFHDYRKQGLEAGSLNAWMKKLGWEVLLNKSSATFRALSDADRKNVDEKKAGALMLANPTMIKRPVLDLGDGRLLIGFKPDSYERELL